MRRGEDPAVFIFELRQLLLKADPTLSPDGKEALLSRQFMRGLLPRIRLKLLENDAIPSLQGMVEFIQRYRAVEYEVDVESANSVQNEDPYHAEVASLVAAVKELVAEQKNLRGELDRNRQRDLTESTRTPRQDLECYNCGCRGHLARNCRSNNGRRRGNYTNIVIYALIDTGSVNSFIHTRIHAALDFNSVMSSSVEPGRYVSIMGDPLNIKSRISCSIKFPRSKQKYEARFLVSDNIRHECVLGWDFLSSNGWDLKAENHRGSTSFGYYVHGRHGTSPVLSRAPSGSHTSGVVLGNVLEQSKVSVLSQSQVRGQSL